MIALSPELIEAADRYLDDQHEYHAEIGERLFRTFQHDRKKSTQVRNLQQIVCSATCFADIEDFIKNQMGKDRDSAKPWRNVGDELLRHLRTLREKASQLDASPENQLALRLRLARGWVRAAVSEYLYCVARDQMRNAHGQ